MKDFEERWAMTRSKGKSSYIFTYGILFWGLPMALVMSLYLHYRGNLPWIPTIYFTVPIPIILGLLWGFIMWSFFENRYQKLK